MDEALMERIADEKAPYVAVWMVTYNHEKYVGQAIEGVMMQQTNFNVKLFIGEDCSKDNTRNVCLGYADKYPGRIQLMSTSKNNLKDNITNVWKATLTSGARYIAMYDGDDYWTDPYKLQKQVDFLDAHPDFTMCFTAVDIIDEAGLPLPNYSPKMDKDVFGFEDLVNAKNNFIFNSTLLFRNIFTYPMPDIYMNTYVGDIVLHFLLADVGKAKYLNEKMAVYRKHSGGISRTEDHLSNEYIRVFQLFEEANEYFNYKYDAVFRPRLLEISKIVLVYESRNKKGFEKFRYVSRNFPKYLKYSPKVNIKETLYYITLLFFPAVLKIKK